MNLIDKIKGSIIEGNVTASEVVIFINKSFINKVRFKRKMPIGDAVSKINDIIKAFNDEEFFTFASLVYWEHPLFMRLTDDNIKRYVDVCIKNNLLSEDVVSFMKDVYNVSTIVDVCIKNGYNRIVNHITEKDILTLSKEDFSVFYNNVSKVPGYCRAKAYMLSRDDLTNEQRVCALKSFVNLSPRLSKVYHITVNDLKSLPPGLLIKALQRVVGYGTATLDKDFDVKELKTKLFPIMIHNNEEYEYIMEGIRRIKNANQRI